jgi:hypothetical protein
VGNKHPGGICAGGGGDGNVIYDEQRDPETGDCDQVPGSVACDVACQSPCPPASSLPPSPGSATCNGLCSQLGGVGGDPYDCLAMPDCHAVFATQGSDGSAEFLACWDIAPLTPVTGTSCAGLDAHACALHNDCVSDLAESVGPTGQYASCSPAPPIVDECSSTTCGSGEECAVLCNPTCSQPQCVPIAQPGNCETSEATCSTPVPTCPGHGTPGVADHCWTGYCLFGRECYPD